MEKEKSGMMILNRKMSTYIDDILLSSNLDHVESDNKDKEYIRLKTSLNDAIFHARVFGLKKLSNITTWISIAFFSFLTIGSLFIPHYSFLYNAISDIGNPLKNPNGYIFFGIALWLLSFMYVPIVNHMQKKLVVLDKWFSTLGTFSLGFAASGMFLIVFFPNTPTDPGIHGLLAAIIFIGSLIGILFYWFVILKDAIFNTRSKRIRLITPLLCMIAGFAVIALFMGIGQLNYSGSIPFIPRDVSMVPWLLDFPFWEWTFTAAITVQLILLLKFQKRLYLMNASNKSMKSAISELIQRGSQGRFEKE